jgi:large subunit ribosomal protein L15
MKYHELRASAVKTSKRVGRGNASGRGTTAGRGTKGQGARTGFSKKPGFEGGQNSLMRRLPKLRGFTSHKPAPETVSLSELNSLKVKTVDASVLADNGFTTSPYVSVKVLGTGKLEKALTVKLATASASAVDAIEKAGGKFGPTAKLARPKTTGKTSRKAKKTSAKASP